MNKMLLALKAINVEHNSWNLSGKLEDLTNSYWYAFTAIDRLLWVTFTTTGRHLWANFYQQLL